LFQNVYTNMRSTMLNNIKWDLVAKLGSGSFETISGEVVNVCLLALTAVTAAKNHELAGIDLTQVSGVRTKQSALVNNAITKLSQADQLKNPDFRVILEKIAQTTLLSKFADCLQGIKPADRGRLVQCFWEQMRLSNGWKHFMGSTEATVLHAGRHQIFDALTFEEKLEELGGRLQGKRAWGKAGVSVGQMSSLPVTIYSGEPFDGNAHALVPHDPKHLPAIWCFCESVLFSEGIRKLDQKLDVTNATVIKVSFDLAHWQKVAAEKYPDGLPKPHSDDPTQWLFNGHPAGSTQPLHVAVARLLGYRWPRQTGSSFPDCPALGPDGLEKFEDDDGIVCLSSVRGEAPAADRVRELLAAAYGKAWKPAVLDELLAGAGSSSLDDWLRNGFFEQHFKLFHHRPFIWHIWDGRKDGFNALVNYHKLDFKLLEKLAYTYLGDWIKRQEDALKQGQSGADDRLLKAKELQKKLELILTGDDPYDIFVRWKKLEDQPIGWHPDLNGGVRLNIRPFMTADVLRKRPNIKWGVDRGKNPPGAPWGEERDNDRHLGLKEKREAKGK
jgi:hypothetical protein